MASTILGTQAMTMPADTTANRPTATSAMMRFNTTTTVMEYYNGSLWIALDATPGYTSISPSYFAASGETITITGTNFQSGVAVILTGTDGTNFTPTSVTRVSATSLTFVTTAAMISSGKDPFSITITNASGLATTVTQVLNITTNPTFTTASGTLGTLYDSQRAIAYNSYLTTAAATCTESDVTLAYTITSGALPTGMSINSSTAAFSGTVTAVVSDTTFNFTVTATGTDASSGLTVTAARAFSIVIKAPVTQILTSSQTWTVPTGVTSVVVRVAAGGGGGGGGGSGYGCGQPNGGPGAGGGAGAYTSYAGSGGSNGGNYTGGGAGFGGGSNWSSPAATYTVTPAAGVVVTIGAGGPGGLGGPFRGGNCGGFGGYGGGGGSQGGQTSFGGFITTSGTSGTAVQAGSYATGASSALRVIPGNCDNGSTYNGRNGGTGAGGAVEIKY